MSFCEQYATTHLIHWLYHASPLLREIFHAKLSDLDQLGERREQRGCNSLEITAVFWPTLFTFARVCIYKRPPNTNHVVRERSRLAKIIVIQFLRESNWPDCWHKQDQWPYCWNIPHSRLYNSHGRSQTGYFPTLSSNMLRVVHVVIQYSQGSNAKKLLGPTSKIVYAERRDLIQLYLIWLRLIRPNLPLIFKLMRRQKQVWNPHTVHQLVLPLPQKSIVIPCNTNFQFSFKSKFISYLLCLKG